VKASLHDLSFKENEAGALDWKGSINTLSADDFLMDSVGKKSKNKT